MSKPKITVRQRDKLGRLAYDLADFAQRLRAAGYDRIAETVSSASSDLGNAGRRLGDILESKKP